MLDVQSTYISTLCIISNRAAMQCGEDLAQIAACVVQAVIRLCCLVVLATVGLCLLLGCPCNCCFE